jgi:Tfp pilus assembly protein PilF
MNISRSVTDLLNNPRILALLLGGLTLFVFLPATAYDFVNWDDNGYVYDNPTVLGGLSLRGTQYAFTQEVVGNWAPLTILSYQLDATLFGPGPTGFHCTNVVLHAVAVALLWIALTRMTGCPVRSAAATILFAVHPLRVESVAWISERKDVLSLVFLALSLLAYDRYCRSPNPWRYLAMATATLAGLLSKATLVTLPVLLLLFDVWPLGRMNVPWVGQATRCDGLLPYPHPTLRALVGEKIPLFVMSLVMCVITLRSQGQSGAIQFEADMPFWEARLPNAVYATAMYLLQTVYPISLQPVYLHPGVSGRPFGLLLGCAASIIACIGLAIAFARRVPAVPMGLAWFLVSLLPVLGVVAQQGVQSHADRYTYIPHVGLCVAIVWSVAEFARRLRFPQWVTPTALTAVVTIFVILDQRQLSHWRNSISLWSHTIAIDPGNPLAYCKMGNSLKDRGLLDAAESHYRQALKADPTYLAAHNNLATSLVAHGKLVEALQQLELRYLLDDAGKHAALLASGTLVEVQKQLKQHRDYKEITTNARLHLSLLLLATGKAAEAAAVSNEAINIAPTDARTHVMHGRAIAEQGLLDPAIEDYQRALQLAPENLHIRNDLATLLTRRKRFDEAIPLYRSIIEREPMAETPRHNLAKAIEDQARHAQQESQSSP